MALDPLSAARAYLATARAAQAGGAPEAEPEQGDFAALLGQTVKEAADAARGAEAQALGALTGRADIVDVVTAVAAAEATLETVLAVRDEVIRAYQEILRMPI